MARRITEHLKASDRMAKTIVFCPTEDAAERMRRELANLNADMMKKYPDYVVRITANDKYGKSRLDYFISVSAPTPVIAVTSQLLSTGVDCKMVKLIVIDKWINSMTEFKQIIGRGTASRADEARPISMSWTSAAWRTSSPTPTGTAPWRSSRTPHCPRRPHRAAPGPRRPRRIEAQAHRGRQRLPGGDHRRDRLRL